MGVCAAPSIHSVHIYNEPRELISRLCGIVSSSLRVGDAVLIVATSQHRDQLVKELRSSGCNLRSHAREERYTMIDAQEMLEHFMVNGMPDRELFFASIAAILQNTKKAARSKSQGLTIFGEMVAVLWEQRNREAALQLEALWNEALHERGFHLHCAYPRSLFRDVGDEDLVYRAHSHFVA